MPECIICGGAAERHHLYTRGSLGAHAEVEENLALLCRKHHSLCHSMGRDRFAFVYGLEPLYTEARRAIYATTRVRHEAPETIEMF